MNKRHLYRALRPLRLALALLALTNLGLLLVSRNMSSADPNEDSDVFKDLPHIALNGMLLAGAIYSLRPNPHPAPIYPTQVFRRFFLILIMCLVACAYAITVYLRIGERGGCGSPIFEKVRSRCWIQYPVFSIELVWVAILLVEGLITHKQALDVDYHTELYRQEALAREEEEARNAVQYQPDLSLYGLQSHEPRASQGRGVALVEIEPLPEYQARPHKDQPRIVDTTVGPVCGRGDRQEGDEEDEGTFYYVPRRNQAGGPSSSTPSSSASPPSAVSATANLPSYTP